MSQFCLGIPQSVLHVNRSFKWRLLTFQNSLFLTNFLEYAFLPEPVHYELISVLRSLKSNKSLPWIFLFQRPRYFVPTHPSLPFIFTIYHLRILTWSPKPTWGTTRERNNWHKINDGLNLLWYKRRWPEVMAKNGMPWDLLYSILYLFIWKGSLVPKEAFEKLNIDYL